MKELALDGRSALVIVAHPDDETIWMGGTILKWGNLSWTIFSLCRKDDSDRAPKFLHVSRFYGAKSIISDLEDEGLMNLSESIPHIKKRILKSLRGKSFDYLFTHGSNGEYGHLRHKGVFEAVKELLKRRLVSAREIFTFAYELDEEKGIARPSGKPDFSLKLPLKIFRTKKNIIEKMYGFKKSSFEYASSGLVETFNELKVR
ncbi:MAG: PIG-L family deacetylase [Candidatus Liptonbacteria bacterium]|nr:PIG-L family deacetylase [Candidatus Liptonbacteria bacterium]